MSENDDKVDDTIETHKPVHKREGFYRRDSIFGSHVRRVLLPVDASDNSKRAFQYYLNYIKGPNDVVFIAHVIEPPKLPSFSLKSGLNIPTEEWAKKIRHGIAATEKLLSDYQVDCLHNNIKFEEISDTGKPGDCIVLMANKVHADIIIMGNRGLSGLKRTMLGSVSEHVVRSAGCAVLIVPGDVGHQHTGIPRSTSMSSDK